jgi:hypothetical protein
MLILERDILNGMEFIRQGRSFESAPLTHSIQKLTELIQAVCCSKQISGYRTEYLMSKSEVFWNN